MKHLSLCWAEGDTDDLNKFDFVFHVALKDVSDKKTIEQIITEQHKGLSGNKAQPEEIKAIFEGRTSQKVLILLDGHDEYRRRNDDINKALRKSALRNCWIVVTSRETKHLTTIREYSDAEAKITGFNYQSIQEYVNKYLGNSEAVKDFLNIVKERKLIGDEEFDYDFPDEDE